IDTVCFDKTGTLTEGRLVLRQVMLPEAGVRWGRHSPSHGPAAADVVRLAAFASPDPSQQVGHATDRAVLAAAAELAPARPTRQTRQTQQTRQTPPRRYRELPFETSRGYAATVVGLDGGDLLAVKGAPEALVPRCRLPRAGREAAVRAAEALAADGYRVLAV
nr:haloacid dehalogenase [Micromonospora sp. DSM 115978]